MQHKQDGTTVLTYAFDKPGGGAQRVLKSFAFADANANFTDPVKGSICFDRKQGKLTDQSRFNYVTLFGSPFAVEIREAMNYCGRDGRLSRKTLESRVNGAATPNESFLWPNWAYDALGNVATQAYTRQLRDYAAYAKATGRRFELWLRGDTKLSRPLVEAQGRGEVIFRTIP